MVSLPEAGFLAEASDRLKTMLEEEAIEARLGAGDVLFQHGDTGDALYVILQGMMEVSILSQNGRKLSMDLMGPGSVFGEIALFDPGERTATITATQPCRVLKVQNADVMRQVRRDPELAVDLTRLAGQRMRWINMQLHEQVFLTVPTRLARKLLHLAQLQSEDCSSVSLSQSELAEYVGATREAVSKTISVWKKQGIIEATRGGLEILDVDTMEDLADPEQI